MSKQSPFYLKRPSQETFKFAFEDRESNPGNCFEVVLRRLSRLDVVSYLEKTEEMVAKYVTGYGQKGTEDFVEPTPLPPVNGEPVSVTAATVRILAAIEYAQVQPEADRYTFQELAAMTVVGKIGDQMLDAFFKIQPVYSNPENPTQEPTDSSSEQSSVGSEATQN